MITVNDYLVLLFKLLMAHAVCDYGLQSDYMAKTKSREHGVDGLWIHSLIMHAMTHAAGVYIVTQSPGLALAELVAHTAIDHAKCRGAFNLHIDQAMHVVCKILWCGIALSWRYL